MRRLWVFTIALATGLSVAGAPVVHAAYRPAAPGQLRRVDGYDDSGFRLWFSFPYFGFPYVVPRRPIIIERNYYPPTPPPPPMRTYYYFCQNPEGYYPQVADCPGGWLRVLPSGGPPP